MSTRIDFHSNVSNHFDYACRLIRKALAAQCTLIVILQDNDQLEQFDKLLWSFSETDFLPHVVQRDTVDPLTPHTPVVLTPFHNTVSSPSHNDIMLNLSESIPTHFSQFKRLIEIVPKDIEATQAGRKRYRFYQQQGYQPTHINAK